VDLIPLLGSTANVSLVTVKLPYHRDADIGLMLRSGSGVHYGNNLPADAQVITWLELIEKPQDKFR
jgi:hypothetical protein